MKYSQKMLLTLFLLVLILKIIPIQGKTSQEDLVSSWNIEEWNEENIVAWEYPTTYFSATVGSIINYTVTSYDPTNFTNPSSGEIKIGNLTTQTTNNKTGEVLALSIWGWFPGLITSSSDWELQKETALKAAQGEWTLGSLDTQEFTFNYSGTSRSSIKFSYVQDPSVGNQNTTLVYDKETGVLLEGYSELIFLIPYTLRLKLVYSDLISDSSGNLTINPFWVSLFAIISLTLFWRSIRKN
ncbi:MAG: hypothetical protein ACW964_13300 [Candidatus Hodarchaeales archaeon]|jgi:hypothetical protein